MVLKKFHQKKALKPKLHIGEKGCNRMNLLIYCLIVAVITALSIWIARESGLDAKMNGFASIAIGALGLIVMLSAIV